MNKQQKLNQFLIDLSKFLKKYYFGDIEKIDCENQKEYVVLNIYGKEDSLIEILSEYAAITIYFGENHWHLAGEDDSCSWEFEQTIDDVIDIVNQMEITYSVWKGGKLRGGSSVYIGGNQIDLTKYKEDWSDYDEVRVKKWGEPLAIHKIVDGEIQ